MPGTKHTFTLWPGQEVGLREVMIIKATASTSSEKPCSFEAPPPHHQLPSEIHKRTRNYPVPVWSEVGEYQSTIQIHVQIETPPAVSPLLWHPPLPLSLCTVKPNEGMSKRGKNKTGREKREKWGQREARWRGFISLFPLLLWQQVVLACIRVGAALTSGIRTPGGACACCGCFAGLCSSMHVMAHNKNGRKKKDNFYKFPRRTQKGLYLKLKNVKIIFKHFILTVFWRLVASCWYVEFCQTM